MSQSNRRVFLMQVAAAGTALAATSQAQAQAKLDEKSELAKKYAYHADTNKVDATKKGQEKHKKDQKCSNCVLFQGKAADAWGGCGIFPGVQVAGGGWCNLWAKKPG
jgi:hypothetical protein